MYKKQRDWQEYAKISKGFFFLGDVIQAIIIFLYKPSVLSKISKMSVYYWHRQKKQTLLNQGLKKNGHFYTALFVLLGIGSVAPSNKKRGPTNHSFDRSIRLKTKTKNGRELLKLFSPSFTIFMWNCSRKDGEAGQASNH